MFGPCLVPEFDGPMQGCPVGGSFIEATVSLECSERWFGSPRAKIRHGLPRPGVTLSDDGVNAGGLDAADHEIETRTRADRLQLPAVADQDRPGLRSTSDSSACISREDRRPASSTMRTDFSSRKRSPFLSRSTHDAVARRLDIQVLPERAGDTPCGGRADNAMSRSLPGVDDRRQRRFADPALFVGDNDGRMPLVDLCHDRFLGPTRSRAQERSHGIERAGWILSVIRKKDSARDVRGAPVFADLISVKQELAEVDEVGERPVLKGLLAQPVPFPVRSRRVFRHAGFLLSSAADAAP